MKKLTVTTFFLACFAISGYAQDSTAAKKPAATYQIGAAKITVWENDGKFGKWKNYKVEKTYKKGDQTSTTNYFSEKELLDLKATIDKAIAEQKTNTSEEKK